MKLSQSKFQEALRKALESSERPVFFVVKEGNGEVVETLCEPTHNFIKARDLYVSRTRDSERFYVQIFDLKLLISKALAYKYAKPGEGQSCVGNDECKKRKQTVMAARLCPRCYLEHLSLKEPTIVVQELLILWPSIIEEIAMAEIHGQKDDSFRGLVERLIEHC